MIFGLDDGNLNAALMLKMLRFIKVSPSIKAELDVMRDHHKVGTLSLDQLTRLGEICRKYRKKLEESDAAHERSCIDLAKERMGHKVFKERHERARLVLVADEESKEEARSLAARTAKKDFGF